MKNLHWPALALIILVPLLAQGPLTPPGAPAPTMKTLDQVEPGTPIDALPYTISEPGVYYVTANLTGVADQNGITISASDVTLDLKGHTLTGVAGAPVDGVVVPAGTPTNIVIKNGCVRAWTDDGIDLFFADGSTLVDLRVVFNGGDGIHAGDDSSAFRCLAADNGGDGISLEDHAIVKECNTLRNGRDGIFCEDNSVITHCSTTRSGRHGIWVNGNAATISYCSSGFNTGSGIRVNAAANICHNAVRSNSEYGIYSSSDSLISHNQCDQNTLAGILLTSPDNRVDNNQLTDNGTWGIEVSGTFATGNLIIRNFASNNSSGGYSVVAGNLLGPILSGTATTTAPFANFEN